MGIDDDLGADGSRLQVVDLHPHADGGLIGVEGPGERRNGRLFEEGDESGCAEDVDVAGAERASGVVLGDRETGFAAESDRCVHHRNANASSRVSNVRMGDRGLSS